MRFSEPLFFLLLPLLLLLFLYGRSSSGRIRFSSIDTLKRLKSGVQFHPKSILLFIRMIALALVILALARPQSGKKFSEVSSEGVDILLAIDTSGSMQALDFKLDGKPTSRLDIVKNVVSDFVKKRPRDRLGLIVFGAEAFTQCPLTLDHGVLLEFLNRLEIGMAGDATAIGSALGVAVKRMKDLTAKSKVVVLLTDGRNNAGRIPPQKAAEIAKTFGVKVYTVGVGTQGKAPFLVDTVFGKQFIYQQVDIDEETLTSIARTTEAKYFRATDTNDLRKIYDEIDHLEKTEVKVKEYTEYNEIFHYFLAFAIVVVLIEMILANTRLRTVP